MLSVYGGIVPQTEAKRNSFLIVGAFVARGEVYAAQVPVSGTLQVHQCAPSLGPQSAPEDGG